MTTDEVLVALFEAGRMAPANFDHRAHVSVACALLRHRPFLEACLAMRDGLRLLAAAAGKPGLYHETITVASMSDLLDRIAVLSPFDDVGTLLCAHPELLDRSMLSARYSPGLLGSQRARQRFVLPDRAPAPSNA